MNIEILNPTYEEDSNQFRAAARLATLDQSVIAIVSNGKKGTIPFFDALETELLQKHGASRVVRLVKSNYSAPAEDEILDQATSWSAMIAGIGD